MAEARKPWRVVFMGTPSFATHILQRLSQWADAHIVGVYCQPDRPSGRGQKPTACPVKHEALAQGFSVFQPQNFITPEAVAALAALEPDFLLVAAYGCILPQSVLDIPRVAPINVHASLLASYRGAAPIQRAIMDGCSHTGISIIKMEAGLDTGPVYAMHRVPIGEHTAGSLHNVLAHEGASLLLEVLPRIAVHSLHPSPQDNTLATHAPKLTKADGIICWNAPAQRVHAHIRGVTPWPLARTIVYRDNAPSIPIIVGVGKIGTGFAQNAIHPQPGELWRLDSGDIAVATQDAFYLLHTLRPENRQEMTAHAFAHGYLPKGPGLLARCDCD